MGTSSEEEEKKLTKVVYEIQKVLTNHYLSVQEAQVVLVSLVAASFELELNEYPNCRDIIRQKYTKGLNAIEVKLFGDR